MQPTSLSERLGKHIVREKEAHDLSRNPELASFPFIGYRTSASAVELVALCDADGLTEGDIVRRRDEFFELVRKLPHDYGLEPRGRNPNGLLGFVFADGCPEPMARFIARQTRISHAAGTGGIAVSWAIDVPNRRIHTHDNPVSIFPPVVVLARMTYPGLDYLESLLPRFAELAARPPSDDTAPRRIEQASSAPAEYDAFISYAAEDRAIALELAQALQARGARVWIDKFELKVGDSISRRVEHGLATSRFGVALISRHFIRKPWTQHELSGLTARELSEGRIVLLPVWHEIEASEVRKFSPTLSDKVALHTADGIGVVADGIAEHFNFLPAPPAGKQSSLVDGVAPPTPLGKKSFEEFIHATPGRSSVLESSSDVGVASSDGMIRVLFVAASTGPPLDLEREFERIETSLRLAKLRERLVLRQVWAASIDRLMQAMLDESPTIVHFSGHGEKAGIVLRDQEHGEHVVSGEALGSLFGLFRDTVQCVVLNACWSEPQAQAIRQHVPRVIGMRAKIGDDTGIAFSTGFYKAIAAGRDVDFAFRAGLALVQAEGQGDEDLLVLL